MVRLTPAGAQLFVELRAAYVRIEQALDDVRRLGDLGGGVLRVGFSTTPPDGLRPALTAAFEQRYPDCRIVASELPTTDLFRWLGREWPVDVFVTWMPAGAVPPRPAALCVGPVIHCAHRAVMLGSAHPLAGRQTVDFEELAAHDVSYPELPPWYGDGWTPAVTPGGLPVRRRHLAATYIEDVLRLVSRGDLAPNRRRFRSDWPRSRATSSRSGPSPSATTRTSRSGTPTRRTAATTRPTRSRS